MKITRLHLVFNFLFATFLKKTLKQNIKLARKVLGTFRIVWILFEFAKNLSECEKRRGDEWMQSVESLLKIDKKSGGNRVVNQSIRKKFYLLKACRIESNCDNIQTDYKQHDKICVIKFATEVFFCDG